MKYILIMQLIIRFDKKTSNMTFWEISAVNKLSMCVVESVL